MAAVMAAGVVEVAVREAGEASDAVTSIITIKLTSLAGSGTGALITGSPTSIHGIILYLTPNYLMIIFCRRGQYDRIRPHSIREDPAHPGYSDEHRAPQAGLHHGELAHPGYSDGHRAPQAGHHLGEPAHPGESDGHRALQAGLHLGEPAYPGQSDRHRAPRTGLQPESKRSRSELDSSQTEDSLTPLNATNIKIEGDDVIIEDNVEELSHPEILLRYRSQSKQVAELTKFKRSMVSQNKFLQESLEAEKTKLVSVEMHLSTSLSLNNANKESISELKRRNEDLTISKEKYRADLKSEDAKRREMKSELAECKTQLSEYKTQDETHARDNSELQEKVKKLNADAAKHAEQMDKAKAEIQEFVQKDAELGNVISQLKGEVCKFEVALKESGELKEKYTAELTVKSKQVDCIYALDD